MNHAFKTLKEIKYMGVSMGFWLWINNLMLGSFARRFLIKYFGPSYLINF